MSSQALSTQLSERELDLARTIVARGGDFERAAVEIGYSSTGIAPLKSRVTRKPAFLAAIHLETARRMVDAAPAAVEFITKLVRDETAAPKLRLDAAKTLLDRAGHIAPRARAIGDGGEKTLGEMTLDELKATQDRLQAEIQARARPVNAQTIDANAREDIALLG